VSAWLVLIIADLLNGGWPKDHIAASSSATVDLDGLELGREEGEGGGGGLRGGTYGLGGGVCVECGGGNGGQKRGQGRDWWQDNPADHDACVVWGSAQHLSPAAAGFTPIL
jgi:hypothetical protein